ncbi:Prokaryotic lipoprotein-attachment site [Tepidimonas charontis]|uniref:Prokaryotic lipoprotein-attachment site n=2 Tax=Tepidimonas charontis TaxID=2267262 RepID=A0A554XJG3_9BURK|nr:Prokaryotic lipoprotein-attachment site [Tepidimonas charontis]
MFALPMIVGRVAVASAALAVLTLTGCGQKGPLSLPQAHAPTGGSPQEATFPVPDDLEPAPPANAPRDGALPT